MNRLLLSSILTFGTLSSAWGATPMVPALSRSDTLAVSVPSAPPKLGSKELAGIGLTNEWRERPDLPRRGPDGSVVYLYGSSQPTIVCRSGLVCTVLLQPGEEITDIHGGDSVRWLITPSVLGSGPSGREALVIKPTDVGLETNLAVFTSKRLYTLRLVSHATEYMQTVSFDYPEEVAAAWKDELQRRRQAVADNTMPGTGVSVADLDFGYSMQGDNPRWRPVRVFNDGQKTYIQFPRGLQEAPTLVALGSRDTKELVNYRASGDTYQVDRVLDRAALILGVGDDETKVEIIYTGSPR